MGDIVKLIPDNDTSIPRISDRVMKAPLKIASTVHTRDLHRDRFSAQNTGSRSRREMSVLVIFPGILWFFLPCVNFGSGYSASL